MAQNERDASDLWLSQVATLREVVAPLVLAHCLREGDDWTENVARFIGDPCIAIRDHIDQFDGELHGRGIESAIVNPGRDDPPNDTESLTDAVISLGIGWGRAGYMLGVAVGSLLGADVLKGGAR